MYILNKFIRRTVIFFFFCYLPIASSESKKIEQPLLTQKYYGLRLGTTRVIYKEDAPSTSFWIMNEKEYPILVQTQVYNDDKSSKAPFIVTPPILKVESNARTRLKVIPTSNLFNKNEESLYWLCVKGVPPLNDNESNNKNNITTNLNVNVVTNSCIKLIYRPKTIDLTTMEIADKLKLERKGNSIVIKNPTSSYVNIANIKSGNLSFNIPNGYIEPFGYAQLPGGVHSKITLTILDDNGAEIIEIISLRCKQMKKTTITLFVLTSVFHSGNVFSRQYNFDYGSLSLPPGENASFLSVETLPGNYVVDVYLNNQLKETTELYFKSMTQTLEPCLTKEKLIKYGIAIQELHGLQFDNEQCVLLEHSPLKYTYNAANQSLLLNAPSKILSPIDSEIADENIWDDGINAFLLNYRANYLHSKVGGEDSYFGQIQPGFNFGPWRLRNLSSWQNLSSEKKFESAYIYAERGLKKIKSKLTVGDKYTSADLFDSVPFRGFSLNKDESMIPFSQRTYYPTIRGIAKTNATVEVRQNGYLIYSTSVPPGNSR